MVVAQESTLKVKLETMGDNDHSGDGASEPRNVSQAVSSNGKRKAVDETRKVKETVSEIKGGADEEQAGQSGYAKKKKKQRNKKCKQRGRMRNSTLYPSGIHWS